MQKPKFHAAREPLDSGRTGNREVDAAKSAGMAASQSWIGYVAGPSRPTEYPVRSIGRKFGRIQQIVKTVTTGKMLANLSRLYVPESKSPTIAFPRGSTLAVSRVRRNASNQFDAGSAEKGTLSRLAGGAPSDGSLRSLRPAGLLPTISPSTNTSTRPSGVAKP